MVFISHTPPGQGIRHKLSTKTCSSRCVGLKINTCDKCFHADSFPCILLHFKIISTINLQHETVKVLTHKFVFEVYELVFVKLPANGQKLPAHNLRQLRPGEGGRIREKRQVLQRRRRLRTLHCLEATLLKVEVFLPLVGRACCTTGWRPRRWPPGCCWRSPPRAGCWPGPAQDDTLSGRSRAAYRRVPADPPRCSPRWCTSAPRAGSLSRT